MGKKVFINLPVKDLKTSISFFEKLGLQNNPQFTDETGAGIVIDESIFVMLLTYPKFKSFIKKEITDSSSSAEVINALSADSKKEVDEMMKKVVDAGGKEHREPEDYGFMYGRSFEDPDGHIWEVFWMNPDHVQK